MQPGQWYTVRGGNNWGGRLIRAVTRSPVAHAVLYVGPQPDGTDIVEAGPKGITRGHLSTGTIYPGLEPPTAEMGRAVAATGLGLASQRVHYNWIADFYIGMRNLGFKVPRWLFKTKSLVANKMCSQLVDYCCLVNGWHLFDDGREPGEVSPADLYFLNHARANDRT